MTKHDLYKTGDADAPDTIKDRNGEVVLALCRVCNQGEIELKPVCPGPPKPAITDELSEIHRTLAEPSPEFEAWVASMDKKLWARFDLSAARLGWEAAKTQAVTVKPLVWRDGFAHTPFGLFYFIEDCGEEGALLERHAGSMTTKSAHDSESAARAYASEDYTKLVLSALTSPPPAQSADAAKEPQAVAVAWLNPDNGAISKVTTRNNTVPLYAAPPAPASGGVSEEMIQRGRDWFNDNFNGMPDSYALVRGILAAAITGVRDECEAKIP